MKTRSKNKTTCAQQDTSLEEQGLVDVTCFDTYVGYGVYTKSNIKKGAFICVYSGENISAEEGLKRLERSSQPGCYLYFYKKDGRKFCSRDCDIIISLEGVKPVHCQLELSCGEVFLTDLSHCNTNESQLSTGDVFTVMERHFRMESNHSYLQPILNDTAQPLDVMLLNRQPEQTEIALQTGSVGRPAQQFEMDDTGELGDNQPMLDGDDVTQPDDVMSLNRQPEQTEIALQTGVERPAQQFEMDDTGELGDNQPMLNGDDVTQPDDIMSLNRQTEIALQTGSVGRPGQEFEINNTGHFGYNQPMLDGNDTAQSLEVMSLKRQPEQTEIALQTDVERPAQEFEMDDTGELGDNQPMLDGDDVTQPDDVMPLNRQPEQTEIALQTGSVGRPAQEFEMDDTGELGDNQPMLDGDDATQPDDVMPLNRQPEQTEIALQTGSVGRPAKEFEMDDTGELGDNQPMLDGDDVTQPDDVMSLNRQPEQTEIALQTGSVGRPAQEFEMDDTGELGDNQPMLDGDDATQPDDVMSLNRQPEQTEVALQTGSVGRPAQQFEMDDTGELGDNQPMLDGDDVTQPDDVMSLNRQPEQTEIALQTGSVGRPAQQFEINNTGHSEDNQHMLDGNDTAQWLEVISLKRQPEQTEIALQTGSVGRPAQQFEVDNIGQSGDNQPMLDGDDTTQPVDRQPEQTEIALQTGVGRPSQQFEINNTGHFGYNQPMLDGNDTAQSLEVMSLNRQPEQTEVALQTGVERPAQQFEMDDTGELGDNQPMLDGDDVTQPDDIMSLNRQPEQTEIALQTGSVGRPAQQFEINNTGHSEDNQHMLDGNDTAQWLEVISLKRQPEQTEIALQTGSVGRPAQQFEVDNIGQSGDNQPMLDGDDTIQPVDRQPEQTEIALQTGVGRPAQQLEMDDTGELGDNQPMLDGDDVTQPDDVMSLNRQPEQTEIALQTGSVGRPAQEFEVVDMSPVETEWLSNHMGHSLNIHKNFYRLHDSVIEMAKVSRLLMAVDEGDVSKYHGKSLQDINIIDMTIGEEGDVDAESDTEDSSLNKQLAGVQQSEDEGLIIQTKTTEVLDSSSDEEESQADNRGSSTGRNCRKPDGRASWTTKEISVLQKNFSHSIEQGQYPFSRSIQALIDRGLLSKGRTVLTVKAKLQNLMKKKIITWFLSAYSVAACMSQC